MYLRVPVMGRVLYVQQQYIPGTWYILTPGIPYRLLVSSICKTESLILVNADQSVRPSVRIPPIPRRE